MRLTSVAATTAGIAAAILGASLFLLAPSAAADPPRERSDREDDVDRDDVDDAIADAVASSEAYEEAMDAIVEDGPQDARKRGAMLEDEVGELTHAISRLRHARDEDEEWSEQRREARTAWVAYKKLVSRMKHHWAHDAQDEFAEVREDVRRLARIYEVDAPARR